MAFDAMSNLEHSADGIGGSSKAINESISQVRGRLWRLVRIRAFVDSGSYVDRVQFLINLNLKRYLCVAVNSQD